MSRLGAMMKSPMLPPGSHALQVIEGAWPTDIGGHAFVIGPAPVPGVPFFFSPGMVHRLDLRPRGDGALTWESGLVLTPSMQARAQLGPLLQQDPALPLLVGPVPNAANTALVPFGRGRMLATFDAGRPVEIDPRALSFITEVGYLREWAITAPGTVMPLVRSPAHPFHDPFDGQVYTANYTSLWRHGHSLRSFQLDPHLVRWDGEGALQRWHVRGTDFSEYVHEVSASRSFVVFADNGAFPQEPGERFGIARIRGQRPDAEVAIVAKSALQPEVGEVSARVARIDREFGHHLVDHDDDGRRITLTVLHANCTELPLHVVPEDVDALTGAPVDPGLHGMFTIADAAPIGRYTIDTATGEVTTHGLVHEGDALWGLGVGTWDPRPEASRKRTEIFAAYLGYEPGMITRRMLDRYGDHPHRTVPADRLPRTPRPSVLVRVDLERMAIADRYTLPQGLSVGSPTFVPGATDYVLALVWGEDATQVWLFAAQDLARGPLAKLAAPGFRLPFTIHTAWLPELTPRESQYRVDVREDLGEDWRLLPPEAAAVVERVLAGSSRA